jgi:hypothetical protein
LSIGTRIPFHFFLGCFCFYTEVQLGQNELGRGEFGIVYQVNAISTASCDCPTCLLRTLYDTPQDRHKLAAKELNVLIETMEDIGPEILTESNMTPTSLSISDAAATPSTYNLRDGDDTERHTNAAISNANPNHGSDEKSTVADKENVREIIKWTDAVGRNNTSAFNQELQGEGSDINECDDISDLSTSSIIRASGNDKTKRSVATNFDTYRKCYMQKHCIRQERPRYAVKRLKCDLKDETKYNASIDLAVEAKFLAALKHPNIVRIRATVGRPGHDSFMIMMDCLNLTLREKIVEWAYETKIRRNATRNVFKRIFHFGGFPNHPADSSKLNPAMLDVHTEKLMASYDLVRGMKFLHSNG